MNDISKFFDEISKEATAISDNTEMVKILKTARLDRITREAVEANRRELEVSEHEIQKESIAQVTNILFYFVRPL